MRPLCSASILTNTPPYLSPPLAWRAQDHANILWALAALQMPPSESWLKLAWSSTGAALHAAAIAQQQQPHQLEQQERHEPRQQREHQQHGGRHGHAIDERDAAHIAWAAAMLPHPPSSAWLQQLWAATQPAMPTYGAQAAAMLLWASVQLGGRPPLAWVSGALAAVRSDLANMQPQGACQVLWALAALRHRPSGAFMRHTLARLQLELHLLPPAGFACVLWALGVLGYCPGATWWDSFWYCLLPTLRDFGVRELANVACGAAHLAWPAPAHAVRALGSRAVEVLPGAGLRTRGVLLLAMARLGWRPGELSGADAAVAALPVPAASLSISSSLPSAVAAAAAMSSLPSSAAAAAAAGPPPAGAAEQVLDACSAAFSTGSGAAGGDVIRLLAAVRRLGLVPGTAWLLAAQDALYDWRQALTAKEAAASVVLLAALGGQPTQQWVDAMLDALLAPPPRVQHPRPHLPQHLQHQQQQRGLQQQSMGRPPQWQHVQQQQKPGQLQQQQKRQQSDASSLQASLLDALAAALSSWPHVKVTGAHVRGLLSARVAAQGVAGDDGDSMPTNEDNVEAWEVLAAQCA